MVAPETVPMVAVIVVEPGATMWASPFVTAALLIVAFASSEELQVTDVVRSCVLLSVYVPMAVNCKVVPLGLTDMLGFNGMTAMEERVASVTVRFVDPEMSPDVAVMVVVPAVREVAIPFVPVTLLMVALLTSEELQVTDVVRSCVLLSE